MMSPFQIELKPGSTIREILKHLRIDEKEIVLIAVNGEIQNLDDRLELGDEVAVFPPVDGG